MASLENALVGAVSSGLANLVVYPLDMAKTVIQTQLKHGGQVVVLKSEDEKKEKEQAQEVNKGAVKRLPPRPETSVEKLERRYKHALDVILKVYEEEGLSGLYKGLGASLVGSFVQSFSYFFWYTVVRKYYFKMKSGRGRGTVKKFSTIEELLLSMIAAATSQLFTSPVSTISTIQQTKEGLEGDNSVRDIACQIYKNEGITGFWKGLKVSMVLTINPSITYASSEKLKDMIFNVEWDSKKLGDSSLQLNPAQNFLIGVLSKIISTTITHPLIIAKASLQKNSSQFKSFQQVLHYLYKHEGLRALWKGILPQLCKGILVQGLLFMFKGELAKRIRALVLISKVSRKRQLA